MQKQARRCSYRNSNTTPTESMQGALLLKSISSICNVYLFTYLQRNVGLIRGSHTGTVKQSRLMGNYLGAGIAQSVYRIATGWVVHGSKRVGAIFYNISDDPWCPFNGYRGSSPWLNKPGVVLTIPLN